jgi:hypothetical protein
MMVIKVVIIRRRIPLAQRNEAAVPAGCTGTAT